MAESKAQTVRDCENKRSVVKHDKIFDRRNKQGAKHCLDYPLSSLLLIGHVTWILLDTKTFDFLFR